MLDHTDTAEASTAASSSTPGAARPITPEGHHWEEAGDAWGQRARDWVCFFEHYSLDVVMAMFDMLPIGPGSELLDVACGGGLAVRLANSAGASVAGLDASAPLIEIARERTPGADIRVGDMFELPWGDESFDAATSVNGIWGGCDGALVEAFRVLRPGGRIAISFWGDGHLDLKPCFKAFAAHSPPDHLAGMKRTNQIARPGVAEAMLEGAGFEEIHRDSRVSTLEWPDDETAWRALASVGPAVPALEHVGPEVLREALIDALSAIRDRHGIYRFQNDHQFVVARKPNHGEAR